MQRDLPRQRGAAAGFTFETTLENEGEILDGLLAALVRNQLPSETWSSLHLAAVRDDHLGELAQAYAAVAQGKRIKAAPPQVVAEFLYQAGLFFADAASDPIGSTDYWQRALVAHPAHEGAFARLESALIDAGHRRAQAELYISQAHHRPRAEQAEILRRAMTLLEEEPGNEELLLHHYQEILRLEPQDEETRGKLEELYIRANRPRDLARLLEQSLVADPPPEEFAARDLRGRLIELYAGPLAELERTMPHVEALLLEDPEHDGARAVAQRLLEVKALAGRAASALARATEATGTPADVAKILAIELEHTRGPKRREVLRRLAFLRQDGLGDDAGAYEVLEQALALDASDPEALSRYAGLAVTLHKELEAGRALGRFAAAARDPGARARLSLEVGALYLAGGDAKRARASFVGVLAMPDLPEDVALRASRALCVIYASERDYRSLADSLERVALLEPDDDLRQAANEELAALAQTTLRDAARAVAAWRRLVDTPARARALDALEPLYTATGNAVDLAFVLEERAKDEPDESVARALAFRAAEVLTAKAGERPRASDAWARFSARFGADRDALAAWIPILEQEGDWSRLSMALEGEASLAPDEERASLFVKLGQIRLQRTDDVAGAINAFADALRTEPANATSRSTLESLAVPGALGLQAARVLEPYYRDEGHTEGLLHVLDLVADCSEVVEERMSAIEEALALSSNFEGAPIVEWVSRGLREAVAARENVGVWIERLVAALGPDERAELAAALARALGDLDADSPDLVVLAQSAAEAHVATGDVAAALILYRRALAYDPTSPELLARVDDLLREGGASAERVALYRAALERNADSARRRELLHTVAAIERNDVRDIPAAIATYETAASEDLDDHEATAALGELYAEAGHWDTLLALLTRSLGRASANETRAIRARMAEVAIHQGDPATARAHAESVLADESLTEADAVVLERVARALEDTVMLRAVLGRHAALATELAVQIEWLDQLGALELASGAPDLAVATWKRAGGVAEDIEAFVVARRLYERAREVAPGDGETAYRLADLLERAEDWTKLPDLYAVMLEHSELSSVRIGVLMRHARLLAEHLDDLGSALISAAQAFELASRSSEYREVLSTFTMLALRGKATHIFAHAMDEAIVRNAGGDPDCALRRTELRMAKARVLAANREGRDAAVAAYRAILEDAPVADAQLKTALHAFDSLLASESSDARRADRRWLFEWRADRSTGVEKAAALEAWAGTEESTFGDQNRALELYRAALALEPDNVGVLSAVARLSLGLGDAEGAVAALTAQRDRSEGPARRVIELELATTFLHRMARPADALAAVSRLLAETPDDSGALALATELLADESTRDAMSSVLEAAQRDSGDAAVRARILRALLDSTGDGRAAAEVRRHWFEGLLEIHRHEGSPALALDTVLVAAHEQPEVTTFWEQAEQLARELERPGDVADAYRRALARPLSIETVTTLGERGVAFQEEWFEDPSGVVRILERVLEVDAQADWAFGRLKMIFDAGERWNDLFALYDRVIVRADDVRKAALYEDAAQIAKDFANDSDRAVFYLEKLLALRPTDAHLIASLERLYERRGAHRELVGLLSQQLTSQKGVDAQRTRSRIAHLWLDELKEPERALEVAEEIQKNAISRESGEVDPFALIERVMATAPRGLAGPPDSPKPVRYRAASILRTEYERTGRDADLARLFEIDLEIASSPAERALGHRQIAHFYTKLGDHATALEHVATLALLEPEVAAHRAELADLAARVGRYDRLAEVLSGVSEKTESEALRAELMIAAGDVWVDHLRDDARAITAYLGVLAAKAPPPALALAAGRKVKPLLEQANRAWELLEVLERLAVLEDSSRARAEAWTLAARTATTLGDSARAILAWEARLKEEPSAEALDALIDLLERAERWKELLKALERRSLEPRSRAERRADSVRIARVQHERLGDLEAAATAWAATEAEFGATDESTDALSDLLEQTEQWPALEKKLEAAAETAETSDRRGQLRARLGDVVRLHRTPSDGPSALVQYRAALSANAREPVARRGLLAMATANEQRPAALESLLLALKETDDWQEVLTLAPLRLLAATTDALRVDIHKESAKLAEERAGEVVPAFEHLARAFVVAPESEAVADELARLAALTDKWQAYADAHVQVLANLKVGGDSDATFATPAWRARFRYRLGKVRETRLVDMPGALEVFETASVEAPADLEIALSTIAVAGREARWNAVATALVRVSGATGRLSLEALAAAEQVAQAGGGWDDLAASLTRAVSELREGPSTLVRDIEAKLGAWHRDRRGDPDAAETAFVRALSHDPSNAELLTSLTGVQRRTKGRPLVDSLIRLSEATGGDLELLREAADVTITTLADRGLARSILGSLIALAETRWRASSRLEKKASAEDEDDGPLSVGATASPAAIVVWAVSQLSDIHEADSHPERTVDLLVSVASFPWPTHESRKMLHDAARIARDQMHDESRAIEIYEGLFDSGPDDKSAVTALFSLYEAGRKNQELLRLRARLVERASDAVERIDLRLASAAVERSIGEPTNAVTLLRANLLDGPSDSATVSALVSVLEETSRFADLTDLLASQAELAGAAGESSVAASWWIRAADVAEQRLPDPDRAIRYHRRALPLEDRAGSLDSLARLLSARGDHAAAAEILERLLAMATEDARSAVTLRFVEALVQAEQLSRARSELEAASRARPDDRALEDRLMAMYADQGAWDALAELHRASAERATDKATKLTHLRAAADLLIRRCATPEAAVPLLEQATVLDPEDRASKLVLADAFVHAGRYDEARSLLRSIIDGFGGRRPKERGIAHYHLALLEIATSNRAQALLELDAATKIDPGNARILRALAELARADGQIDRAERSYRALLVALKRPEEATEDAEIVRSEVLLELSSIAAGQDHPDRARELLESALESASKSLVEARRLEEGLRTKKDFPMLVRALEARLARSTTDTLKVEVLTELARVLDVELGHLANAFVARQKILALTPGLAAAHEASLAVARRVDGVTRYVEDVEQIATQDERAGRREAASALYVRMGQVFENDVKDDVRALAAYERGLAAVTARPPTDQGPMSEAPLSIAVSRQALVAIRAIEPIYMRLGRNDERLRLLHTRVAMESAQDDPAAAADARYRLSELLLDTPDGALEGALLVTQALELDHDLVRAERVVRAGLAKHSTDEGLVDLFESIGRNPGHEAALLDALEIRAGRQSVSADVIREAVSVAAQLGAGARAEAMLAGYVTRSGDTDSAWAFGELANLRESAGDAAGAIAWKKRAVDVSVSTDARRLRFEMAKLTETALGDSAAAAALYEVLFEEDPSDRGASEPMFAAYRKLSDAASLVRLLPRAVEQATDDEERSRLRLERVRLLVDPLGRRDEAISPLADLVGDEPNNVAAAALLADLFEQAGRKDDLRELLARQIDAAKDRQDAKHVEALSLRRAALIETDDADEARATLYSALDWAPESRAVLEHLVRLLAAEGMEGERLDVRERLLRTALRVDAEREALALAELRTTDGNPEAAERALEIGFRIDPASRVLRDRLEASYRAANATAKLAELKAIEAHGIEDPVARVARLREVADLYALVPEPARVASTLAEAFAIAQTDVALATQLIAAHTRAGDIAAAVAVVAQALDLVKDDGGQRASLLLDRANLRVDVDKDEEAAEDLVAVARLGVIHVSQSLDIALERVRARAEARGDMVVERTMRLELATARAESGDVDAARPLVTELLRREPKDREALRLLARIEERAERWDAATVAYRRLIPLEEGDLAVDTALRLADACERAGRLADARGALERTRIVAPKDEALRLRLERLYESIGAFRELAEMSFNDAREAADDDAKCSHLKRAGALLLQDGTDTDAAIDALVDAHALSGDDIECTVLLADAYTVAGKTTEAQTLISSQIAARAGRRSPELASLYHRLARIANAMGDRDAEMSALTSGLEADAQNGFIASELASLALEVGDMEVATRALRSITLLKDPSTSQIPRSIAYQYLGEIARQQGDSKRAMMLLKRALDDDPSLENARQLIEEIRAEGG